MEGAEGDVAELAIGGVDEGGDAGLSEVGFDGADEPVVDQLGGGEGDVTGAVDGLAEG